MFEVLDCAPQARISPRRVLSRHVYNELTDVLRRRRSAWAPFLLPSYLGCDEVAVPAQKRSGCGNGRNLGQRLAAQSLGLDREPARRCCTARSKSLTSLCRLQSHPAQYVSGIPSAAILLSISHPIRCSTRCLANVRARISGLCLLFIHPPAHGSEVSPAARNTLDSARIPRASKLLICGLFQKGRVLAQDGYRSRDFVRAGTGDAPSQDRERGAWQDRRALSNRNTSIM